MLALAATRARGEAAIVTITSVVIASALMGVPGEIAGGGSARERANAQTRSAER